MVKWTIVFAKRALKDANQPSSGRLREWTQDLLDLLAIDPFQNATPYGKLVGDLEGACSRRINIQYRLVYEVFKKECIVRVLRMWTHYD